MTSVLGTGLKYTFEIKRLDGSVARGECTNLLPQESVDLIAGLIRGTAALPVGWYVGLFEGNYVPTKDITAATLNATAVECQAYDEAARPAWAHAYDGTAVIDSLASKAIFTMNAAKRVYGAFVISTATKGGTTGTLLSIARFSTPQDLSAGETFSVAAGLTLIPTAL